MSKKIRSNKSSRKSRNRCISKRKSPSKKYKKCYNMLSDKIKKNLKEYKSGRYVSRQQAIAVSYSQIRDKFPCCKKYFSRK
jgi:hypothetical protein